MTFTPADLPDLTGRRAIVTGSNVGIGEVTARELAARGAEVTLACRNTDAAREAARRMTGTTRVEALDLASLDSVRHFAERWDGPLDLLVNNAGVMTPPAYRETADGHELMFGTNHLGHFALTGQLLPALLRRRSRAL
jgi:NAD(P)-dependent dehydrogenase (short-subunit alcohol dehydrogenase family)